MVANGNTCQHVKDDGTICQAAKVHGSDYCFFHDPAKAGERAAARRTGGEHGRMAVLPPDAPHRRVATAAEVIDLLGETINHVRTGLLDPRVGNCVGYLAGVLLKAVEQGEVEERLAVLEAIVGQQPRPSSLLDASPEQSGEQNDPLLPAKAGR
jgi:hypothetical protein